MDVWDCGYGEIDTSERARTARLKVKGTWIAAKVSSDALITPVDVEACRLLVRWRPDSPASKVAAFLASRGLQRRFPRTCSWVAGRFSNERGRWRPMEVEVILPVDGRTHAFTRQILRLDLRKVALLRARKSARAVPWEQVTLVHLFEGAVTFEIADEPPLRVAGYKHPEEVLEIAQECYKAATERILQALAAKVTRPTP